MANEEMIQKHLDNFLAKIAGETPVDDTIQNSTEFWINKIAEQGGGGTEVIANPTLAGTEDDLEGIEIDGTKYVVPKGAYIATKTSNTQIGAESMTFITANYLTTPCFVEYDSALYRIEYKDGFGLLNSSLVTKSNIGGTNNSATLEWIRINSTGRINPANVKAVDVVANGGGTATNPLTKLEVNGANYKVRDGATNGLGYLTTAPTAANTDGIKIVVLSSEPATKYEGYLYLITEA